MLVACYNAIFSGSILPLSCSLSQSNLPFKDPYLTYVILCLYLLFSSNIAEVLVTWCQTPINHTIQYRPLHYVEAFISNISWSVKNLGMYNSYRAGKCFTLILVFDLWSLLKTLMWLGCVAAVGMSDVRLDSLSCSFTPIAFLTWHLNIKM